MAILGIPFGWVLHWLQELIGNYGWTIIIFTVIVKILLIPLTIKQQKSTTKMAAFQPKLQELEKRYKNNKQKYQEEMMKLYEKEGYSPMNGCWPMLVQMVVLFGIIEVVYRPLQYVLQISKGTLDAACKALELTSSQQLQLINIVQSGSGKAFETIQGILSAEDILKIKEFDMSFLGLDLSAIPTLEFNWLLLIPILSFLSALLMTLMSLRQQSSGGMPQQNSGMMKAMLFASPVMTLFFTFQLPAGVGIYWIVSNVVTFITSEITRKIYTPEKLAEMAAKDKGSERQRQNIRKKREMMERLTQQKEDYEQQSGQDKEELEQAKNAVTGTKQSKQDKPSTSHPSQSRKPASDPDEISANDRIAAARKRLAEMYGDDNEDTDTTNINKK